MYNVEFIVNWLLLDSEGSSSGADYDVGDLGLDDDSGDELIATCPPSQCLFCENFQQTGQLVMCTCMPMCECNSARSSRL